MPKAKAKGSSNKLVPAGLVKEVKSCRPLRLFIKKQKKKGNEGAPFTLRSEFLQTSTEKQVKYFQKAIDKYIQLLDEKNVSEHVQIEGQLFEYVLTKKQQKTYFELIDAPKKPVSTVAACYNEFNKENNNDNPKAWKLLSADERQPYIQMLKDAKTEYSAQVKNFAENLPERLKPEYLSFLKPRQNAPQVNGEEPNPEPIRQRRKSVQAVPENFQTTTSDHQQKLTRTQLEDLHKCIPSAIYYEKKVSDDKKPTFANTTTKNTYIRSVFNQLSDKKRHKFILKSTKQWEEYLQLNPTVAEHQIPTLHLLLTKNDDIHYYFSSLGLPVRPPMSALLLYNNEKLLTGSQQNWAELTQATKDDYIKRLTKLKNEYHQKLVEFVEKTLPSDYVRLEFFRNIKFASKDYELVMKDQVPDRDEGQSKITQYLQPKKKTEDHDGNEFDRIKQQLLSTHLTNDQTKLVERLGQLMKKYVEETTALKKNSSNSKITTGPTKSANDKISKAITSHRPSTNSDEVILLNGEISSDDAEHPTSKTKKKRKRDGDEAEEASTAKVTNDKGKPNSSSSSIKKRK